MNESDEPRGHASPDEGSGRFPGDPADEHAEGGERVGSGAHAGAEADEGPEGDERPEGDEADERAAHRAGGSRRMPLWMDTAVTMVIALVIAVLVKTFLIQPFYIPSASMSPTLVVNDKIVVSKLTPGVFDLQRGDVIVFEDPDDWLQIETTTDTGVRNRLLTVLSLIGLAPDPSQNHLVKRLIGLPGDHVVCEERGAQLEVNGVVIDEPYINQETPACQYAFDVTVPDDSVWVLGDNRFASADSSYHEYQEGGGAGFVPVDDVTGRAVFVFWPASNWSGLGEGHAAFDDVPDPA
ncbi:signal peptidase I [Brachybacterium sp. DNPG3]